MGLYVQVSGTADGPIYARRDISRSAVVDLSSHEVTASIIYDPSSPYPDVGATPCGVTVGFIQNVIDVDTWVQFEGRRLITQHHDTRNAFLDSDIPNTGSSSDLAWYSGNRMSNGYPAFTSFRYGPNLPPPANPTPNSGIALASPGGGTYAPSTWTIGRISMSDFPRASYYTNFRGASSGAPLLYARRQLRFRIWICMLIDGASPSVAANYHILARSNVLISGHRFTMNGGGPLSGIPGNLNPPTRWPAESNLQFTPIRGASRAESLLPVVSGTRGPDYNDGLTALGVSPSHIGL